MDWTGAAQAATGALQHLRGASIHAAAAIAHSDQRDATSITDATSCSPPSRQACVLQTLCQSPFSFVIADTNSLISRAFERFPVPSYLLVSAFWPNATWAMLTNAASYQNITILVSRSIFYAHWPVGHSSPPLAHYSPRERCSAMFSTFDRTDR